ncbi:MAG: ATP-dependent metallopeptidase FtsH/Yme1/Tma family protein, partial [Magnetospirillum sp.]|nr:ATP-dependent metallopeptidase FtsH/Yme1/Tma family protein [Magnetospirillum sp.]
MNFSKNLALWVIIALLLVMLFNLFQTSAPQRGVGQTAFSDFMSEVDRGQVADVTIQGYTISGHFSDGRPFSSYLPPEANVVPKLREAGVRISAVPPAEDQPTIWGVLVSWFPMLLLIGVWIFFMRQMQSGGGKAMGFEIGRAS